MQPPPEEFTDSRSQPQAYHSQRQRQQLEQEVSMLATRRQQLVVAMQKDAEVATLQSQNHYQVVEQLHYEAEVLREKLIKMRANRATLEEELYQLKDKKIRLVEDIDNLQDVEEQLISEVWCWQTLLIHHHAPFTIIHISVLVDGLPEPCADSATLQHQQAVLCPGCRSMLYTGTKSNSSKKSLSLMNEQGPLLPWQSCRTSCITVYCRLLIHKLLQLHLHHNPQPPQGLLSLLTLPPGDCRSLLAISAVYTCSAWSVSG